MDDERRRLFELAAQGDILALCSLKSLAHRLNDQDLIATTEAMARESIRKREEEIRYLSERFITTLMLISYSNRIEFIKVYREAHMQKGERAPSLKEAKDFSEKTLPFLLPFYSMESKKAFQELAGEKGVVFFDY